MNFRKTNEAADVPIIMQMEALECGAASLAMILAYYGRWISLGEIREDCGVSRDGSLASNIVKAARKHGLEVKMHRYSLDSVQKKVKYPAIIHWDFNHFVVLDGFENGKAIINDPARGKLKLGMDEFDRSFTGVVLEFEPGADFVREGGPVNMFRYAFNRLKGSGSLIFLLMLTAALSTFAALILPAFSRFFTDEVLENQTSSIIIALLIAMFLLFVFQMVVTYVNTRYSYKIRGKLAIVGSAMFMWKILHMPMRFFSQRMPADLSARQALNDSIAVDLVSRVAPVLINIILLIFYLFIMIRYNIWLSLAGVLAVLINLFIARRMAQHKVNLARVMLRDKANLASAVVSGIEMIESIKSSGSEIGYFQKLTGNEANISNLMVKEEKHERFIEHVSELVETITGVFVLMSGVWMIMQGHFTAGMLVAFQAMLLEFLEPVQELIETGQMIQEMRTSMERVDDVLNYPDEQNKFSKIKEDEEYDKLSGEIELKDITFGYSPLAKPLLEDFSLSIKPGQKIALVGMSGCGKSTISKLISGLYEPWKGEITYDGKKIGEIPREVFNGSIMVVDQDISLFEDSISDNLKMWDDSIQDYEVIMAARDADIHEAIISRPGGYDYQMRDGGYDFSGGQRQRLEIARVLAADPTILILDEATSALDSKTEHAVIKAIEKRGITCIVIAHRLSTIRDADQILVMDQGKVVEKGTHEELMEKDGLYSKLITTE